MKKSYFWTAASPTPVPAREIATLGAGGFFADGVARARDRATGREYNLEAVRGIVVGFAGLICSVLLMGALYCLISSGASAGEIAGAPGGNAHLYRGHAGCWLRLRAGLERGDVDCPVSRVCG